MGVPLSALLSKGNLLAQKGDLAGATTVFKKASREFENRCEPWISLSAIHGMQGQLPEALQCARKAVAIAPTSLQGWVNLGNAAQSSGIPALAADAFQRARGLPGCPPDIALDLGLLLVELGRWAEADKPLREYIARHHGHQEATLALGKALAKRGDSKSAVALLESYCTAHPSDYRALMQLGITFMEMGDTDNAQQVCSKAEVHAKDDVNVLFLKAALLTFHGSFHEARDTYERIDKLYPGMPRVLVLLSGACQQAGDNVSAIAYARAALSANRHYVPGLVMLANLLLSHDTPESRRLMLEAEAVAPHDSSVKALKGTILNFEGDKPGAWESVRAAIEGGSPDSSAILVAADVGPAIGKADEAIELLENALNRPGISIAEQRALHFSLTKICDKAKQFDRAFGHAEIANRLKNASFDSAAHAVETQRLMSVYSATAVSSLRKSSTRSELPLFIVGMPRSGTSLLEQILSCHSKVYARGETTDVRRLTEKISYYPDGVRDIRQETIDRMAAEYLTRLHELAPEATRVTDKLPGNYRFLGFISQLFPATRILNCRRDPRDVCLSNYFTEFNTGHVHSYNLESLAQVQKEYEELMVHWKSVLSIPILDVQYEQLVANPREWVERILSFCGLEWEDACLDFHQSKRQVVTASYDQVRQPLYTKSVARWKNYEKHLAPVSRILGLMDDTLP
jgi:tetratricopeptide (TPR) repeat protein